jgi:Fic family protein
MRVEAIASSKIEGTVTSLSELFVLEAAGANAQVRSDTKEVQNYVRALEHGIARLPHLPVSGRLISELHRVLMDGVSPMRGAHIIPGEFKTEQNWIGARLIQNARFVPPPPKEAGEAMSELEKYVHLDHSDLPLIVKLAMVHYQFETIHPFPDGNGRVGRLLIPLILSERGEMSHPLLYLSPFFEQNYAEYIDRMYAVSRDGAWEPWIEFFLRGVLQACGDAISKTQAIQQLHHQYHEKIRQARSSALLARLVDYLFDVPAITIPIAMESLKITYNAAKNNIAKLLECKILSDAVLGPVRPKWFYATEIIMAAYREEATINLVAPSPEVGLPAADDDVLNSPIPF